MLCCALTQRHIRVGPDRVDCIQSRRDGNQSSSRHCKCSLRGLLLCCRSSECLSAVTLGRH